MIKVKALREFTYGKFDKITNLVRNDKEKNENGRLYEKDTFECTEEMAKYLTGGCGYDLVKIIEVIPEPVIEESKEDKEEPIIEQVEEEPKKVKKTKKK